MSTQTLVVSPVISSWTGDMSDFEKTPNMVLGTNFTDIFDCLSVLSSSATVLTGHVQAITPLFATPANEWLYVMVKVVGEVDIITTGTNYTTGAITGTTRCYGTSLLPGFFVISTYNVSSIAIWGVAASSSVRYISSVVTYPTDTRIIA